MKRVYFVRHGESEGNAGRFGQTESTPLTAQGIKQAETIAHRVKKLDFDVLVSSHMRRAHQTAEIIAAQSKHPIIISELFCERRKSAATHNIPHDDPASKKAMEEWWQNFGNPDYQTDAESYFDVVKRATDAWNWLRNRPEEVGVVATHGLFLRILLATALFGEDITPSICRTIMRGCHTNNTGLFVFDWVDDPAPPRWDLISWNDQSHLG